MSPDFFRISRTERRRLLRQNSTRAEWQLWWHLRNRRFHGYKFRRQHHIGKYIADFYCAELRLVIEVDGDSHFMESAQSYDKEREGWLLQGGYLIIRFTNEEVVQHINIVLDQLLDFVNSFPNPSSPREEGKQ